MVSAWPFLISHRYPGGYRTLLAPPDLVAADLDQDLVFVAGGTELDDPDTMYAVSWTVPQLGDCTLLYRTFWPRGSDYGLPGSEQLLSKGGRRFHNIEGVLLKVPLTTLVDTSISATAVERIHAACTPTFTEHWESNTELETSSSSPMSLPADPGDTPLHLIAPVPLSDTKDGSPDMTVPPQERSHPRQVAVISGVFTLTVGLISAGVALYVTNGGPGIPSRARSSTVVPTPTSAPAATSTGPVSFQDGKGTNWYLDVDQGSAARGTQVLLWDGLNSDGSVTRGKEWAFFPVAGPAHSYVLANSLGSTSQLQNAVVLTHHPSDADHTRAWFTIERYDSQDNNQVWTVDGGMLHNEGAGAACLGHTTTLQMLACGTNATDWSLPSGL